MSRNAWRSDTRQHISPRPVADQRFGRSPREDGSAPTPSEQRRYGLPVSVAFLPPSGQDSRQVALDGALRRALRKGSEGVGIGVSIGSGSCRNLGGRVLRRLPTEGGELLGLRVSSSRIFVYRPAAPGRSRRRVKASSAWPTGRSSSITRAPERRVPCGPRPAPSRPETSRCWPRHRGRLPFRACPGWPREPVERVFELAGTEECTPGWRSDASADVHRVRTVAPRRARPSSSSSS